VEEKPENIKGAQELSKMIAENDGEEVHASKGIGVLPTRLTNRVLKDGIMESPVWVSWMIRGFIPFHTS